MRNAKWQQAVTGYLRHGERVLEKLCGQESALGGEQVAIEFVGHVQHLADRWDTSQFAQSENVISISIDPRGKDLHGKQSCRWGDEDPDSGAVHDDLRVGVLDTG